MDVKPLVPTMIRTEFGDVLESEAFHAASGAQGDFTYVPGYSDLRRARDQHLKELAQGKRYDPAPILPVRLHLVRNAQYSGKPDNRKSIEFGNDGYRPVTKADIGQAWITAMPNAGVLGPNDEIRVGDCTLMVASKEAAARNAAAIRFRTDQMTKESAGADLMRLGASHPGSEPSMAVTPGETHKVGSAIKSK